MQFKKILEKITPSEKEQKIINAESKEVVSKLRKIKDATIIIGGSDAKETVIRKDKRDIDVFVAFSYKYKDKSIELSNILETNLKKLGFKFIRLHGSRDYFHYQGRNVRFEVVPILKIKKSKEAINITDISPLHVTYVKNKIKYNKKLAGEIRLAKAFCYANDCYGAESYIKGFSGYSLELLVINYGSFMAFVKSASKWKKPGQMYKGKVIIDQGKHYKNKDSVLFQMNEAKLQSPLILVDPLQKERNAAAALSYEQFDMFTSVCQKFLKNQSEKFFEKTRITKEIFSKNVKAKEKLVALNIEIIDSKSEKEDIVGAKLKKFFDFICAELQRNDFVLKKKEFVFSWMSRKADFYFIFKNPILPLYKEQRGPPIKIKKAVEKFKSKWKKTKIKVKKARLYAKVKREFSNAQDFLKNLVNHRIKNEKSLRFIKEVKW